MQKRYTILVALIFAFSGSAFALDDAHLKSMENYTRLIVPVESGADFRVASDGAGGTKLTVEHSGKNNLNDLRNIHDNRVQQVSMHPAGIDGYELDIAYQKQGTESFAYFQPNPPAIIVDIWRKANDDGAKPGVSAKKNELVAAKPSAKAKRKIASIEKEESPKELSVEPLRVDKDIFVRFLAEMPPLEFSEHRIAMPPRVDLDNLWTFTKPSDKLPSGVEFKLAQKLYQDKKYGLCIRTLDIAMRDNPQTPYKDEMQFLQALAYKNLGESTKEVAIQEKANDMIKELGSRVDEAGHFLPFHQAIRFYFYGNAYLANQWLDAIDQLEALSQTLKPVNPEYPYVQISLAELYIKMGQPRRAERIYRFIQEHYPHHLMAKEAAYRQAYLLAKERNYDRTIELGNDALKAYPEYVKVRPVLYFHLGEAFFEKRDYKRAQKSFEHFIELAPSAIYAAEAYVRLGEIAEIVRKDLKEARADYLEAKNRFPFSNGDKVASLHLARLNLPSETEVDFQIRSLQAILKDDKSDIEERQMANLALIDYYLKKKNVNDATEVARLGMADNSADPANELFKAAYVKSLYAKLRSFNEQKKYADALALYQEQKVWLDQFGPEVKRELADTYRELGFFETSNKLIQEFLNEKRKLNTRKVASQVDERALRIERARNALAQERYEEALSLLGNDELDTTALWIRANAQAGLKHMMEASASAEKGLKAVAEEKARRGSTADLDSYTKDFGNILKDHSEHERDFEKMRVDVDEVRKLLSQKVELFEFAHADALWYLSRHKEAIAAYNDAIAAFPKSDRVERAEYNTGMSYVALGRKDDAVKTLTALRDKSQTLWGRSAAQELQLIDWEKKYSSVLKSLPPSGLGITN